MNKLLHASHLNELVRDGEFSLVFVSEEGELIIGKECVCTSFHSKGRTMNVRWPESNQVRKVRRCSIIEFNGMEVVL